MATTIGSGVPGEDAFPDVTTLSYEDARDELVEIVRILELGQMSLDESLAYWERGEALARRCEDHLAGARKRIETALAASEESSSGEKSPTAETDDDTDS